MKNFPKHINFLAKLTAKIQQQTANGPSLRSLEEFFLKLSWKIGQLKVDEKTFRNTFLTFLTLKFFSNANTPSHGA